MLFRSGDYRGSFIPGLTPSQFQSIIMLLVTAALAFYIFYFDRVPFYGKEKVGRNFRFVALKDGGEFAAQDDIAEESDGRDESGETCDDEFEENDNGGQTEV